MKTIITLLTLLFTMSAFSQVMGSNTIQNKKTGEEIEVKCADEICEEIVIYKNFLGVSQEIKRINTWDASEIIQRVYEDQRNGLRKKYLTTFTSGWGKIVWGEGWCVFGIIIPLMWPMGAMCTAIATVDITIVSPVKGTIEITNKTNLKRTRNQLIKLMQGNDSHMLLKNKHFKRVEALIEKL